MSTRRCARSAGRCSKPTSISRSSRISSPRVRERAVGQDVLKSLSPFQTVARHRQRRIDPRARGRARSRCARPTSRRRSSCWSVSKAPARRPTPPSSPSISAKRAAIRCWSPPTSIARPPSISCRSLGEQINIPVYDEGVETEPGRHRRNGAHATPASAASTRSSSTPPAASTSTSG